MKQGGVHILFLIRQLLRSSNQALVFILCVVLSIGSITAFSGFSQNINRVLLKDARKIHAADIIIRSGSEISIGLARAINRLVLDGRVKKARYYRFYSVVRTIDDDQSLLSDVKIVEAGYPFYGEVVLKSGRSFHHVLKPGSVVVGQSLLDRLQAKIGDSLKVGFTTLTIVDVVIAEPDQPMGLFSIGPRVFAADGDREALGLIRKGSRIRYMTLLKVLDTEKVEEKTNEIADGLKKVQDPGIESVDTFQTARSRIKRFLDNFLFFLKLVGLFILMIAGFGIQGTLTAFLNEKKNTIAIFKTVGATNRYITIHFMLIVFTLGMIGILLGFFTGYLMQHGLAVMLDTFLPENLTISLSWTGILEGVFLGLCVISLFAFIPLYRIKDTKPIMILRKEKSNPPQKWPLVLSGFLSLVFFSGLVFWHMKDFRLGLYFIAEISGLILVSFLFATLMLFILKRLHIRSLPVRLAVKSMFRPNSATRPIIITLTASLYVIFTIFLIEENLDAAFIESYPEDAPNMFFVNIQQSQVEDFSRTLDHKASFYPVVRARVAAINGKKIDLTKERKQKRDNFGRTFNLTYRESLLETEELIKGNSLFRRDWDDIQVSILDMVVDMKKMGVGDTIEFKIQGVPLKARISSIRTQTRETLSPFFYFVFPEKVLKQAPQTIFTAIKAEPDQIASIQNRVVKQFPNISVIDVSQTAKVFSKMMKQLSKVVRFFSILSIAAGILILVSTIFATRVERIIEAVYYKILGAGKKFVFMVFALENLLIGLLSGLLALAMAQLTSYLVTQYDFELSYQPFLLSCFFMICITLMAVVIIGVIASRSILNKKPITFLKEQPDV
ncbi:MAG: FtsX-like permease family protein [Desulfobacterales bacterium]|nr:FtsX-like permease family protein [Desulfobacterales bacterium]